MTIIEFLEARVAEDEAEALDAPKMSDVYDASRNAFTETMRKKALAECAAKRAILAECRPGTLDDLDSCEDDQPAPMWVARTLAAVYKDHPDYQQEWAQ